MHAVENAGGGSAFCTKFARGGPLFWVIFQIYDEVFNLPGEGGGGFYFIPFTPLTLCGHPL